ncbi:MAG: right-handed parallel beta-helix repeat-containing protein [Candidatus Kariarchaeaceae archaeon]
MQKLSLLFLLLFSCPTLSNAAIYYAQANGEASSGNPPTAPGPCGTVGNCLNLTNLDASTFSDGDTIYFCDDGGVFRGSWTPDGGSASAITYQAASGDTPIIYGSVDAETGGSITWTQVGATDVYESGDDSFMFDAGMIYYNTNCAIEYAVKEDAFADLNTNWEFWWDDDDSEDSDGKDNCVYVYHTGGSPELQAQGIEITSGTNQNGTDGVIKIEDTNYITLDGLTMRYGNAYCIKGTGDTSGASNITVQNMDIAYCGGQLLVSGPSHYGGCMQFNGGTHDSVTIDNNIISQCFDECVSAEVSSGSGKTRTNFTISNNYCSLSPIGIAIRDNGSGANTWTNNLVDDNIIYETGNGKGWSPSTNWSGQGSIEIYSTTAAGQLTGITIRRNTVYSNAHHGIQFFGGDGTVEYNRVYDNGNTGINIYDDGGSSESDVDVFYNLVYENDDAGIAVNGNQDTVNIYNNTFVNNDQTQSSAEIIVLNSSTGVTVKNTIMYNSNGKKAFDVGSGSTVTSDYNFFYNNTGTMISHTGDPYTQAEFSTYQSEKSQDANSYSADPLFANVSADNYNLQSSSTASDVGTDVGLTEDLNGVPVPQYTGVDIGAFEYNQRGCIQQ